MDEDPSIVTDLSTAPWAEVVDQVSAHPYLLDFLWPQERGEGTQKKEEV